jgi:hypothetical protein
MTSKLLQNLLAVVGDISAALGAARAARLASP